MKIPRDEDEPYWVERRTEDGRLEKLTGPHASFECALEDMKRGPEGDYVITNMGRVEWPVPPNKAN